MENRRFNIKYANLFIKRAKEDLEVAKVLLETNHYPDAVYHSQQCAEKAIKAEIFYLKWTLGDHGKVNC
ncbi:hypothetical protein Metvu_0399 [Methanocaldococcus vulcanius M7]|uniref:HEPN domain-containing protein n=1 Tax=Methanocaldococcus vulcanius (strain ATCC 700851 / DSM 12094 / M7) TaxID=579137 RepID=C9RFA8_METVM|nr:HEPN domain-containing protein [Methanocaldococcus vulcanius]ACX72260.1 hypothetical protein Metvu_0399 [Methanocaldococcus vulcanius M7]